jgi:hypothetical protein
MQNESDHQSEGKPARLLPEATVCRASHSGIGDLIYCLAPNPEFCPNILNFGNAWFCCHPQRQDLAARTQARPRA